MAAKKKAAVVETAAPPEVEVAADSPKFIGADGVATSPLPDYPGRVVMPVTMTLPIHKKWQAHFTAKYTRQNGNGDDSPALGFAHIDDPETGQDEFLRFRYDAGETAVVVARAIEIENLPADTDLRDIDTYPYPVAVWLAKVGEEWETSQLRFRWAGGSSLGPSGGQSLS